MPTVNVQRKARETLNEHTLSAKKPREQQGVKLVWGIVGSVVGERENCLGGFFEGDQIMT